MGKDLERAPGKFVEFNPIEQQVLNLPEHIRQNLTVVAHTQKQWDDHAIAFAFQQYTLRSRINIVTRAEQLARPGVFVLFLGLPAEQELRLAVIGLFSEWEQTWYDTGGRVFFPNGRPANLPERHWVDPSKQKALT